MPDNRRAPDICRRTPSTLGLVLILLWLVPAAVVTVVAMVWVGWIGREHERDIDPEVAMRRMGEALERSKTVQYAARPVERDRSSGVAIRRRA